MIKIKQIISRIGWDSIVLILFLLIAFATALHFFKIEDIWRDVCISFISAVIVFVVTITIPRYSHRKAKIAFLERRVLRIINGGKCFFNNIHKREELCMNKDIAHRIPSDKEIKDACNKLDLSDIPTAYPYTIEETPSWDLLFNKYLHNIDTSITEIVSIAGEEDIHLVNTCDEIREIVCNLQLAVNSHIKGCDKPGKIFGMFMYDGLQELANKLRKLEKYRDK